MSDPTPDWNPEDGPPPSDDELAEATALARALDGAVATAPDSEALRMGLRVRALAHPDRDAAKAVADRVVRDALQQHRSAWFARAPRLRLVAGFVALVGVGLAGGAYVRRNTERSATATTATTVSAVFTAPVEPGAGSMPATRLYDRGLRDYRASLLGGDE